MTLLRAKLCHSLSSTCFNFPLCRMDAALVFVVTLFLSPFLHFSYFPFLLFSSLLCLFLLEFQSFEKLSYSKFWLIEDVFVFTYFICPFACFGLEFLFIKSYKDLVSRKAKERETGNLGNVPLIEKLEERSSILFNLRSPPSQGDSCMT